MNLRNRTLTIDGIDVQLVRKRVKHLRLVVAPPDGRVRVSVPVFVPDDLVWLFLQGKLDWIRDKQVRFADYVGKVIPAYISGEQHYLFGQPFTLQIIETSGRQSVIKQADTLLMYVRSGNDANTRSKLLDNFYRNELKQQIPGLLELWQLRIGRKVMEWGIKKMKTRWGSCNITRQRIWLNLELAKRPLSALEYVLVHELVHLLERNHNRRFYALMDSYIPNWRQQKQLLNERCVKGEMV